MNKVQIIIVVSEGFQCTFSSPHTNRRSEAIDTAYDDIIAEGVRNKSTEENSGIQLGFEASETDRQCHQNTF